MRKVSLVLVALGLSVLFVACNPANKAVDEFKAAFDKMGKSLDKTRMSLDGAAKADDVMKALDDSLVDWKAFGVTLTDLATKYKDLVKDPSMKKDQEMDAASAEFQKTVMAFTAALGSVATKFPDPAVATKLTDYGNGMGAAFSAFNM